MDAGANIVIVDVRSLEYYEKSHILGAISLPKVNGPYTILDGYDEIYTYCTWADENISARAAQRIITEGYENCLTIEGGLAEWEKAGYPVDGSETHE